MVDRYDVVIVGAGHAGARAAVALRDKGFAGSVLIVGEEPGERASLSRAYVLGSVTIERVSPGDAAYWQERKVDLLLGARVAALDAGASVVRLADGRDIGFGHCIMATGDAVWAPSRSEAGVSAIHLARSIEDIDAICARLEAGQ